MSAHTYPTTPTNALLKNASMISGTVAMPAVSPVLENSPNATANKPVAKQTDTVKPAAPSRASPAGRRTAGTPGATRQTEPLSLRWSNGYGRPASSVSLRPTTANPR